jgi:hypothetical protein
VKRSPLKRGKPMRAKNPKRAKQRQQVAFGEKAEWIRTLRCVVGEAYHCSLLHVAGRQPAEAAHVKSRGAGGRAEHLIPLCVLHHHEQHTLGISTFAEKYGIDLTELAAEYERRWQTREAA